MAYPNISYPGGPKPMGTSAFQPQTQQFFPVPQGSVYTIENPEEVQNIPCSNGVSIALCLNKNLMYIKTIQAGSPLFWVYKITPMVEEIKETKVETDASIDRVAALEAKIDKLLKEVEKNGKSNEPIKLVDDEF